MSPCAFNRTSLELKLEVYDNGGMRVYSFNRTSLELKQGIPVLKRQGHFRLLIAPVWN